MTEILSWEIQAAKIVSSAKGNTKQTEMIYFYSRHWQDSGRVSFSSNKYISMTDKSLTEALLFYPAYILPSSSHTNTVDD